MLIAAYLFCFFLVGFCSAFKDGLFTRYQVFAVRYDLTFGDNLFWDPKISYRNKWAYGFEGEQIERFWGSSRWFVFLTDAWHLLGFFHNALIGLGTVLFAKAYIGSEIEGYWNHAFLIGLVWLSVVMGYYACWEGIFNVKKVSKNENNNFGI